MKKYLMIFALVAITIIGIVAVNSSNNLDALVIANVEALANSETSTSASCDKAFLSKCKVQCSTCGLSINTSGRFTNFTHVCNR